MRMRGTAVHNRVRLALAATMLLGATALATGQPSGAGTNIPGGSGLPVPRFVSLKSDRVNMRKGPGTDYPTAWVYRRAGLPLEVIKEFEGWRQVRDADGAAGWVLQSFLSGPPKVALRHDDSERARPVAMIEAGVIANLSNCDGRWCRVNIDRFQGYIEQKKLWGVYEGEVIK
jgi:SH3-like domain-containing protein